MCWKDKKWKWEKKTKNEKKWKEKWKDNEIGDEGAKTVSESLKINTSLTELDLGSDEKKLNLGRCEMIWKKRMKKEIMKK